MKKIVFIAFAVLLTAIAITTSCDKVDAPYLEEGGSIVTGDTVRKLLLEDFTGHLCPNCPGAHLTIEGLKKVYGDRMVVSVIHTGYFATVDPAPYDYDFTCTAGDAIGVAFGADQVGLPKGMVNRKKTGGYLMNPAAYATAVSKILDDLDTKPDIFIEIKPTYKSSDKTIAVDVKMSVLKNMPAGKYNISVIVVESKIIAAQKNTVSSINNGHEILDYEHNEILRGAINTTWGEEFADASLSVGQTFSKSYSNYKIGTDWKSDNLTIIAYVSYADGPKDKEIIQAEEVHLK